ncbi:hypothetical protein BDA96_02G364200 [Sorghum bicolor]|uniref:Uncharacterized protein n=1 Tax=Sorghum bicolor TaxID=4558 RepID=A0A921UVY4_SORBI|nr:hypothetical protein BDA96_02G364200 [Sorghum bicolor]
MACERRGQGRLSPRPEIMDYWAVNSISTQTNYRDAWPTMAPTYVAPPVCTCNVMIIRISNSKQGI